MSSEVLASIVEAIRVFSEAARSEDWQINGVQHGEGMMNTHDKLLFKIKEFIQQHPPPSLADDTMLSGEELRQLGYTPRMLFPTVSKSDVAVAETDIGFPLPQLLKRIYLEISNGIAGFSYEIMGLKGGCATHCGTLVDAYVDFKKGGEYEKKKWKLGLLPFCHWGCNRFSCVDCTDSANPVFTYEDSDVWTEQYTLPVFFEMWLKGGVLFSQEDVELVPMEFAHPITGERMTISARQRRKPRKKGRD